MAALAGDRNTQQSLGDLRQGPVAAAQLIYAGSMVMRNAAGQFVRGVTGLNLIGAGRAEERVDNSAGAAGAKTVRVKRGTFLFANSASTDEITAADIGTAAYCVDDQTVAKTNGGNTRSPAGMIDGVENGQVWVRFDPALTKAFLS